MKRKIKIVDEFLDNPDKLRKEILSQKFYPCHEHPEGGTWPGYRTTFSNERYAGLVHKICKELDVDTDQPMNIASNFQYCTKDSGESWVHVDDYSKYDVAAVLYLSPNPPKDSGTLIYEALEGFGAGFGGLQLHKITCNIENKYNRLAAYDVRELHKSDKYFGENKETARLFFVCFIRGQFLS